MYKDNKFEFTRSTDTDNMSYQIQLINIYIFTGQSRDQLGVDNCLK